MFGTGTNPNPTGPGYFGLADPTNALSVTGAVGTFSDANLGLSNVAITGYVANNYLPHFDNDQTIPLQFQLVHGSRVPGGRFHAPFLRQFVLHRRGRPDHLPRSSWPAALSTITALLLTLANGDVFDVWSDGGSGDMIYGAAVATSSAIIDYQDPYPGNPAWRGAPAATNLSAYDVPEPSTWAMMILGFAGLGFAGYRKARKTVAIAA